MISTFHTGNDKVKRRVKCQNGGMETVEVTIPPPILMYNMYMNGVDVTSDQLLQCYEILRKTKKYWKTLFFHLVHLAVVN